MSKDAVMESYLDEMKDVFIYCYFFNDNIKSNRLLFKVIKPLSHNSEEVKKIIPLL